MATEAAIPLAGPIAAAAALPPPPATPRYWRRLEMWASAVAVLSIAVAMVLFGPDPFFAVIGAVWGLGAIFIWRGGRVLAMVGTVVALLPALLIGSYAVPAMYFLVTHPLSDFSVEGMVFVTLALAAVTVLIAAIAAWFEGRVGALRNRTVPRALGIVAAAVFAVVLAEGAIATVTTPTEAARAGDVSLGIKDVKYSASTMQSGQDVAIHVTNGDASFHTFTIDGHVDKTIASKGQGRVSFHLAAGTYRYYCAVPGHDKTMHGTLTVR
jgi:plastocyanin